MKKQIIHKFFGKVVMLILSIVMAVSVIWLFDSDNSIAYAAGENYYFTESQVGLTITDDMTAPKPTTAGRETYIFAGYFEEATCENPVTKSTGSTVYKKFVPADIMGVKAQVTNGTALNSTKTDMRLVTTVDGLDYKEVGFDVYFNGATTPVNAKATTVYKRIIAADGGISFGYSPEAFSVNAKYFTTVNLVNISQKNFDKTFFIKPYWKTLDGTKVYGLSRMARVSDSYNRIVNVPVRLYTDATVNAGTFDVAYGEYASILEYKGYDNGDVFASVTVTDDTANGKVSVTTPTGLAGANGMVTNLRFQVKRGQTMPSNTTFMITSETFTTAQLANVEYKMFSLTYQGVADTSWYDDFKDETEFVITTPADLYGLANIVNNTTDAVYKVEKFSGKTVKLGADISINQGTIAEWLVNISDTDVTNDPYEWRPIGIVDASPFDGAFDGNGHTISGIYLKDDEGPDTAYQGLFGRADVNSTICNLRLEDSYFESVAGCGLSGSYAVMGSVVGRLAGNMDTVYSNATVISGNKEAGGLIGRVQNTSKNITIDNCWFDGTLKTTEATYTGTVSSAGIAAKLQWGAQNVTVSNCLNTGAITYEYTNWGTLTNYDVRISQIFGNNAPSKTVTIKQCVAAGSVNIKEADYNAVYDAFCNNKPTLSNNVDITTDGAATYNGYKAYTAASKLGFYDADNATSETNGKWVCRETNSTTPMNGIPVLESFCDEWIDVSWYLENTSAKEYTIKTVEELYGFSEISNILKINFEGKTIRLGADIKVNFGDASEWAKDVITPKRDWTPINSSATGTSFKGTFDGAGHTISGIWVDKPDVAGYGVGLFGYSQGTIQNFRLENSYFNTIEPYTGSVVGFLGGSVNNVYSNAYIKSNTSEAGGLVGRFGTDFPGSISGCWFDGEVTSSGQSVGGVVSMIRQGKAGVTKNVMDCLVTGTLTSTYNGEARVGGLVGYIDNITKGNVVFQDCLSACESIATKTGSTYVGSVVGYACLNTTGVATYTNVYTTTSLGGVITGLGNSSNGVVINGKPVVVSETEVTGESAYIHMDLDFSNTWGAVEGGKPVLKDLYTGTTMTDLDAQKVSTDWYYNNVKFNKTMEDSTATYTIKDAADLYGFSKIATGYNFNGKTVQLDANHEGAYDLNPGWTVTVDQSTGTVTTSGVANIWTPIGQSTNRFAGEFDGKGKTILGVYCESNGSGLFGYGAASSKIKNFELDNSYIKAAWNSGLVIANTYGSIQNVYVKEKAVLKPNGAGQNIGGIAGSLDDGTEKAISNCWFDGTVESSGKRMGAIVGIINKGTVTIENCLVSGTIISTSITDDTHAGGVVGFVNSTTNSVTLKDSVVTGNIKVKATKNVGTVLGNTASNATLKFTNVYYTNEPTNTTGATLTQSAAAGCGTLAPLKTTGSPQRITNLTGTEAYKYTELDLASETENTNGIWVLRSDGAPQLNGFADSDVESYANVQTHAKGWYYNFFTYDANGAVVTTVTNSDETTSPKTYTILDDDDMFGFADLVNTDKIPFSGLRVALGNDIVLNDATKGTEAKDWAKGIECPQTWKPIGSGTSNPTYTFSGVFDGENHTISGVYVNQTTNSVGLFGNVKGATIQNVRLGNSYFKGNSYALGSVVGWSQGVTMKNVYSDAIVQSTNIQAGGIIGRIQADSALTDCWFNGELVVNYEGNSDISIGGIVGNVFNGTTATSLENCLYTGSIDLTNTYTGTSKTRPLYVGGLIGKCQSGKTYEFKNCFAAGTIDTEFISTTATAVNNLDSVVCKATGTVSATGLYATTTINSTVNGKTSSQYTATSAVRYDEKYLQGYGSRLLTQLPFTSDEATSYWVARLGEVPIPFAMTDVVSNELALAGLGRLDTSWYTEEQKDTDGAYVIDSIEDFYGFIELAKTNDFKDQTIKLGTNIYLNDNELLNASVNAVVGTNTAWNVSEWIGKDILPVLVCGTPIGGNSGKIFAGTFDGNGKTISGLYMVSSEEKIALFGITDSGSEVKDFRLLNSYFKADKNASYDQIAAIISDCRGTLSNVYTDAIVEGDANRIAGMVAIANTAPSTGSADNYHYKDSAGKYYVYNTTPVIENCWFDGIVKMGATGRYGGGIVSTVMQNGVNITNCLFTGKIESDYAADENVYIGGIIGHTQANFITEVKLSSVISAGEITGNHNNKGVSAVIGMMRNSVYNGQAMNPKLTFDKVFATRECYQRTHEIEALTVPSGDITSTLTVTGNVTISNNEDRLIGYCDGGSLDFVNDWVMREQGVPVPATFADMTALVTPITDADAILALTAMDSAWRLRNAENYGLGHYVLTTSDKTYENFTTYLDALRAQGFKAHVGLSGDTVAVAYIGTESEADGVYNVIYTRDAGEWVLNILFARDKESADNKGKVTLTISNGLESLSPDLEPETSTTSGTATLSMVKLAGSSATPYKYYYGNSFVFQLPNGHFVINDGGEVGDFNGLIAYLKKLAEVDSADNNTKIIVDAWTVTHQHGDHFGVVRGFENNPQFAEQIAVNAIYVNEPNQEAMNAYPEEAVMSGVIAQYRGINKLKDADGNKTKVYWCQTGQRYYFDGLTLDIVQSQELIPVEEYGKRNFYSDQGTDFNTASTSMLFTTANGKKVLIMGDSNYVNMDRIMKLYGSDSNLLAGINVYQAPHHGKNTSMSFTSADNSFTDYLVGLNSGERFDATLFPCSVLYQYEGKHETGNVFPYAKAANRHLIEDCTSSGKAYDYGDGTIVVTLGDTILSGIETD